MTKWLREYRLMPVVLIAAGCLFALKAIGLVFEGGYTLGERLNRGERLTVTTVPMTQVAQLGEPPSAPAALRPAPATGQRSWMQEMFGYPDGSGGVSQTAPGDTIITGSVGAAKPKESPKEPAAKDAAGAQAPAVQAPPVRSAAAPAQGEMPRAGSPAERAILERLHQRRQELDARARELELRENLLKAAEKKVEDRIGELKAIEERIAAVEKKKDDAEAARIKGVATMYEAMKPRDAAKIFDRLDMRVLLDVATKIKPARMSEIMAQMSPETAEKLTVELAGRPPQADKTVDPNNLPKIGGRPDRS